MAKHGPFTVKKQGDKFRVLDGGRPARNAAGIAFGPLSSQAAAQNLRDRLADVAGEKKASRDTKKSDAPTNLGRAAMRGFLRKLRGK